MLIVNGSWTLMHLAEGIVLFEINTKSLVRLNEMVL